MRNKNPVHNFYHKLPLYLIFFTAIYLFIMMLFVYFLDFKSANIFGLIGWLEASYPANPVFWIYGFSEASPTEHLQWFFLGASMLLAALYFAVKSKSDRKVSWAWFLLLIGLTIMFYEDMQNLRHNAVDNISAYLGIEPSATIFWVLSLRSTVEILIYLVIGTVMVIALIYIIKSKNESLSGKKLLVSGYLFYGIASVASATRGIGNWYANLGNMILSRINDQMSAKVTHEFYQDRLGFYFVDFVFEEPLELLGAVFITAALISFINHYSDKESCNKIKRIYFYALLVYAFIFWFAFQGFYIFHRHFHEIF